jgi:fumarate reductase subunit C
MGAIGVNELLVIWIVLSLAVGLYSRSKGTHFWFGFLLSLMITPLIGLLIVGFRPSAKNVE